MKEFDFDVEIHAKAYGVEAETEEEARTILYDAIKNHPELVIEQIFIT